MKTYQTAGAVEELITQASIIPEEVAIWAHVKAMERVYGGPVPLAALKPEESLAQKLGIFDDHGDACGPSIERGLEWLTHMGFLVLKGE
jgi:hypothetical protein